MPSTYSPSLRLELIGNGEQASNWGNTTNTNLGTLLEQAITGVGNIVMAGTSVTLVSGSGIADEARNAVLVLGGTLSASCNLIVPTANKFYAVRNATTGSQNVVVKTSAGTGVGLANGYTQLMYCDGTNVVPATLPFNSTTGNVIVSGDISVVGTVTVGGATTLSSSLSVAGTTAITGATTLSSSLSVAGTATITGATTITGGATMNGDVTISKATPALILSKAASSQNNIIYGQTNGSSRWIILPGTSEAETGSNAGSNFHIQNYNDSGVNIETPFVINRSTGATTVKALSVTNAASVGNNLSVIGTVTSGGSIVTTSTGIKAGNGEVGEKQIYLHNSSRVVYFYLGADGDNVGLWDQNAGRARWSINNNGNMSVWNNLTIGGGFTASSFITSGGDVNVPSTSDGTTYYSSGFVGNPAGYQTYYRTYHQVGAEAGAQIVVGGNQETPYVYIFKNNGYAYASVWVSLSDSRVKSDQTIISNSLNKLSQIKGITYKRNDINNMDGSDIIQAGVLAQDVAEVLPECVDVSSTPPKSDPDGPGLMSINYNGVIALLVNAVNELSAKVDALEKKAAG